MGKVQVLVRASAADSARSFGERVRGELAPGLLRVTAAEVKLTFTDLDPPRVSVIPFSRDRVALFSVWTEEDPRALVEAVTAEGLEVWGYRVRESVPRSYRRDWPAGEVTPGVGLLTVFNRKRGLDDATFFERWHGRHTPLTLELHPVWNYVRNVVEETVFGAPHRDAIVEEHFEEPRDLLSLRIFFGGSFAMVPNMARVWLDVRRFIDLGSLDSFLTHELWLRG